MQRKRRSLRQIATEIYLIPIHLYRRLISPLLPATCLYHPSCSVYCVSSVRTHGIIKGSLIGISRIVRCTSLFFIGGIDPVPEQFSWRTLREPYTIFRKRRKVKKDSSSRSSDIFQESD